VGDEGPRGGAAIDGLQHRGLDLEEAPAVEHPPHGGHDAAALHDQATRLLVDEQVEVALAEAHLDVGQTVPLLGQGREALAEQLGAAHIHRELTLLGAPHDAGNTHEVTEVEGLHESEGLRRNLALAGADLQPLTVLEQGREDELSEHAERHDAARDGDGRCLGFELGLVCILVALANRDQRLALSNTRGVGVDARCPHFGEACPPDFAFLIAHEGSSAWAA
jgi:hypothetical protein